jgi:hypothetical protein
MERTMRPGSYCSAGWRFLYLGERSPIPELDWNVNADLILPLFADEILPVSIRSVEANGPDTQALFHPV